jgi:hypothetical protein
MTIYCSKKLETFLGQITQTIQPTEPSDLGDWNGHLFTIDRKKCLIFMNNKTCYSVVMTNVLKKDLKDFGQVFKERLIRQLDHDLNINEGQEIKFRKELGVIGLSKSNNDKKIIGTINHHVDNLKYNNYGGGVQTWDEVKVTGILNDYLVGTKITVDRKRNRDFFRPIELMQEFVK